MEAITLNKVFTVEQLLQHWPVFDKMDIATMIFNGTITAYELWKVTKNSQYEKNYRFIPIEERNSSLSIPEFFYLCFKFETKEQSVKQIQSILVKRMFVFSADEITDIDKKKLFHDMVPTNHHISFTENNETVEIMELNSNILMLNEIIYKHIHFLKLLAKKVDYSVKQEIEDFLKTNIGKGVISKRTVHAEVGKEEKKIKYWMKDVELAVTLAVRCAEEQSKKTTKEHETLWRTLLQEKGIKDEGRTKEPHRTGAFRSFRDGLPDYLKGVEPKTKA